MRERLITMITAALAAIVSTNLGAEQRLPAGFVELHEVDATIMQDMRYAGPNNFTGKPLPGYERAQCVLKRAAADALARVQRDLAAKKLSLMVFDCYRPVAAVKAMADWALDGRAAGASKRFFPRAEKSALFALGYIARRSTHSRGTAVDLTLVDQSQPRAKASGTPPASCTAPYAERGFADGIDMGTGFDCFDAKSHTASSDITTEQRQHRQLLVNAMRKHGFVNYAGEWWHFSGIMGHRQQGRENLR